MAASRPPSGRFVWYDLMSTDPLASCGFYSALFGWAVEDMPAVGAAYVVLSVGDEDVAGIVPFDPALGAPSHWTSYVSVSDVDATAKLAGSLGGTVRVPPTELPGMGRVSVIADPQGAPLQLVQDQPPPPPGKRPLGTVAWNALWTADPASAAAYYGRLFGWSIRDADPANVGAHYVCSSGKADVAGIVKMPSRMPGRPAWLAHVSVASLGEAGAQIAELGGVMLGPPPGVPRAGRLALAIDAQGALFGLLGAPAAAR